MASPPGESSPCPSPVPYPASALVSAARAASIHLARKTPVFVRNPLDVPKVYAEVQARGGYRGVCLGSGWLGIARTLGVDLTGQTAASTNMRTMYEKCMLPLENVIRGEADEEATKRVCDVLEEAGSPSCRHILGAVKAHKGKTNGMAPPAEAGEDAVGLCVRVPTVGVDQLVARAVEHAKASKDGVPAALLDDKVDAVYLQPKERDADALECCVVIAYDPARFGGRGGHQVCFRLGSPVETVAWANLAELLGYDGVKRWQDWVASSSSSSRKR